MNIYTHTILDNGDIQLKKINIDTSKYNVIHQNENNILLQKQHIIHIFKAIDIIQYSYTKSKVEYCYVNNTDIGKYKYRTILNYIYELINDGTSIIKNTQLNIKTIKKTDEGFSYLKKIGISIQGVDSNKCLSEIINQCTINNYKLKMKIKLYESVF